MAVYRTVYLSFWTDAKVDDDFTPEDKYFYLYLLTNPHTNICGCYQIGEKQFSRETGYNSETISRLISRFENVHDVIRYDPETKEILILNWHKYNWTKSEDLRNNVRKVAENIKSDAFKEYVFSLLGDPMETLPTPSPHRGGTSDTDTVTVSDTVTDTVNVNIKQCVPKAERLPSGCQPVADCLPEGKPADDIEKMFGYNESLLEAVRDWIAYKKQKRQPYQSAGLKSLLTTIRKKVAEYGEDAVIEVMTESMGQNYQGITWDRIKSRKEGNRGRSSENKPVYEPSRVYHSPDAELPEGWHYDN